MFLKSRSQAAVAVEATAQGIQAGTPCELFSANFTNGSLREFDVTPDGDRLLFILNPEGEDNTQRLTVISNWQSALRQ
jgi:hypothetical protein